MAPEWTQPRPRRSGVGLRTPLVEKCQTPWGVGRGIGQHHHGHREIGVNRPVTKHQHASRHRRMAAPTEGRRDVADLLHEPKSVPDPLEPVVLVMTQLAWWWSRWAGILRRRAPGQLVQWASPRSVAAVGDDRLELTNLDSGGGGDLLGYDACSPASKPVDGPVAGGGDGVRHPRLVLTGVLVAVTARR